MLKKVMPSLCDWRVFAQLIKFSKERGVLEGAVCTTCQWPQLADHKAFLFKAGLEALNTRVSSYSKRV